MMLNRLKDPICHYNKAAGPYAIEVLVKEVECPELRLDLYIRGFSYVVLDDPLDEDDQVVISIFFQGSHGLRKLVEICSRWDTSIE